MSAPSPGQYPAFLAELYDESPVVRARTDVPFFVELAREAAGPVLELGCGTGRILIPTAEAGCEITGLDSSGPMLERCRAKLAAEHEEVQQRVRLVEGSMAEFDLGRKFALITTPFRSFQHLLTVEAQLASLAAVRRHLAPGGRLLLDLFHTNPRALCDTEWREERFVFPEVELSGGRKLRLGQRVAAVRLAEQINEAELNYYVEHPDGRTECFPFAFPIRWFSRFEVEHLLARAGFRVAALWGSYDRSPFCDDSAEMIFLATA
jgi:SAM-dependent methyltransferase